MAKKQYIGFIILAVVFLGAIFYWYSLRPSIIKKGCYNEAREKVIELGSKATIEFYNTAYKLCLQKKGL